MRFRPPLSLTHRAILILLATSSCVGTVDEAPAEISVAAAGDAKIPLDPSRITVDTVRPALGNYAALFDEQAAVGDPRAGSNVTPTTQWDNTSWNAADYPMGLVVDLGATYDLTNLAIWDSNGSETDAVTFQIGSPTTGWTTILSYPCDAYTTWVQRPVTGRTRYLHITRKQQGLMREIVVYGALVSTTPPPPSGQSVKIPITSSMVKTVDAVRPALGNYAALYDEQTAAGDPRASQGGAMSTQWDNTSWNAADYPMGFYIDLGATYDLTDISIWDANDGEAGAMVFQTGSPGAWTTALSYDCLAYNTWVTRPLVGRTRYLHITRTMRGQVREIVLYGSPAGGSTNQAPVVSAGAAQTITLPTSSATLTGTASDADGSIASRQWSQVSGPATASIATPTALSTTVSSLVQGTYTFKLTVTDNGGLSSSATTTVTVNPQPTGTGTHRLVTRDTTTANYGFYEYLPANYASGSNFPVVIFLHGLGECGDGNGQLSLVQAQGPPRFINGGKNYSFVLFAPQSISTWNPDAINTFITWVVANYKVDPKRIYVTGLSLGGEGTFAFVSKYPARAAAAMPIASSTTLGNDAQAAAMVANGLAVWAFHARDDVDPHGPNHTDTWITAMGKALGATSGVMATYVANGQTQTAFYRPGTHAFGWVNGQTSLDNGSPPSYPLIYTLYDSGGHIIWDRAYQDDNMWAWMLLQHKP